MTKPILAAVLLCAALSCGLRALAQANAYFLVIEQVDGNGILFQLNKLPRLSHSNDKVIVTTNEATIEFDAKYVAKAYLKPPSSTTSVNSQKEATGDMQLRGELINLTGYSPHETVSLYGTGGRLVWQKLTDDNGQLTITFSQLIPGINIIKTNHQSYKFTKK